MKRIRKLRIGELSILTKLIVIFLIIILPLYGAGLWLNASGRVEVARQITESMKNRLHYDLTTLENEIQRINYLQNGFASDRDLQNLSSLEPTLSKFDRAMSINGLGARIDVFQKSSELIKDVTVYMPDAGISISALQRVREYKRDEEMEALSAIHDFPLIYWNGRMFISLLKANPVTDPPYIIKVELSMDHIQRMFVKDSPDSATVLFNNDWSITNRDAGSAFDFRDVPTVHAANDSEGLSQTFNAQIDGVHYFFALEKSAFLQATMLSYAPQDYVLGILKQNQIWIWLLSGMSVLLIGMFAYFAYLLVHVPLRKLVKVFRSVEDGNFNVSIRRKQNDEFGYLYLRFESMVSNLRALIDTLYVQKLRLQQSEFKQLQSQVNPHFWYNCFFILHQLIANKDFENALPLSQYLGDYYQYVTRNSQMDMPLIREYKHAATYVEIQKIRFYNRIEVELEELPEKFHELTVPRLILQPCIENAYQHGLNEKMSGGRLLIAFREHAERLCIVIEDNGEQLQDSTLQELQHTLEQHDNDTESTGLINVHRRLRLKFGDGGGIRLSRGRWGGLQVEMSMPIARGN